MKCTIVTNGGQVVAIVNAIANGISDAGGNPDLDLPMIISQEEVSRAIGKLIAGMVFVSVSKCNHNPDQALEIEKLLEKVVWAPLQVKYNSTKTRQYLIECLNAVTPPAFTEPPHAYEFLRINRKMTPVEAFSRLEDKYSFPGPREFLSTALSRSMFLCGKNLVTLADSTPGQILTLTFSEDIYKKPVLNTFYEEGVLDPGTMILVRLPSAS